MDAGQPLQWQCVCVEPRNTGDGFSCALLGRVLHWQMCIWCWKIEFVLSLQLLLFTDCALLWLSTRVTVSIDKEITYWTRFKK